MEVVVIDGLGGGIGRSIVETIKKADSDIYVLAIGTNSTATMNMKKGGADAIATGENAIVYNAKQATLLIGPLGLVFENSMFGEISPNIARAISASSARKYFVPASQCSGQVLGVQSKSIQEYIKEFIEIIKQ